MTEQLHLVLLDSLHYGRDAISERFLLNQVEALSSGLSATFLDRVGDPPVGELFAFRKKGEEPVLSGQKFVKRFA